MKLSYPAIFDPWEEGGGYTVSVPDLPGCITEGSTLAEAIFMAEDAASGWILSELENGNPAPAASRLSDIISEEGGMVSLIALDMDAYADQYGNKAVRKNVTIPAWLNTFAEKYGISFSKALQSMLSKTYDEIRKAEEAVEGELGNKTTEKILKAAGIDS